MKTTHLLKVALAVALCHLLTCPAALAENKAIEGDFCVKIEARECSTPVPADGVAISKIESIEDGSARLHFRSKIAADEDQTIMHVWRHETGTERSADLVHVSKSGKLETVTEETVDGIYAYLNKRYGEDAAATSLQAVVLGVRKSPGFRTYSKIRVKPGTYTVEVCDLAGNVLPGGEAKSVKILP